MKLPDAKTRRDIIQIRLDAMRHDDTINLNMLVEETDGCSGAEVVNLCRNAAMAALGEQMDLDETTIMGRHFEKALLHLRRDTSQEVFALFDALRRDQEGSNHIRRLEKTRNFLPLATYQHQQKQLCFFEIYMKAMEQLYTGL